MKNKRHDKILSIIENEIIETQEELTEKLKQEGIFVTQATVSRDIKQMKLIKVMTVGGKSRYAAYSDPQNDITSKFLTVFKQSHISSDYAGNMVVVKTFPGMAPAAAAVIDSLDIREIVGTIAGDDTIMMVCRNESIAEGITMKLVKMSKN